MKWADLDMENDELAIKLQQKNEQLKAFSQQITKLELDVVKAKQEAGDAMNQVHELAEKLNLDSSTLSLPEALSSERAGGQPPVSTDSYKSTGKKDKFAKAMSFLKKAVGGKKKDKDPDQNNE